MLKKTPGNRYNKNDKINFCYYCENCGHTISFYAFEAEKKVCNWCGRLNYKNDLTKFKDTLNKKLKEVKTCQ